MTFAILLGFVLGLRPQKGIDLEKTLADLFVIFLDRGIKHKRRMPEEDSFTFYSLHFPAVNYPLRRRILYNKFFIASRLFSPSSLMIAQSQVFVFDIDNSSA